MSENGVKRRRMMSNKPDNDNVEVVCEGWLTKSPPTKRILRARWRRRYFILRHSGELPGQYFLWYYENRSSRIYTDWNCRLLKGKINLDQCEQVDAGLRFESGKQKYQHMFTIRTPKRIFYLAAESEDDMNKWVDCVCHVCGLKPFISDDTVTDDGDDISQATTGITEISPPVTPSTIITGPYIPISECISGKPIHSDNDLKQFLLQHGTSKATTVPQPPSEHRADSYDVPRNLRPPEIAAVDAGSTPPPSPGSESVFTDDVVTVAKKPPVNWGTFPRRSSDSSVDEDSPGGVSGKVATASAPPRPPKQVAANDNIFRYDFTVTVTNSDDLPESPHSETGSMTFSNSLAYSNLPSPSYSTGNQIVTTPPAVNRELKPGRKCSDSTSNEPSPNLPAYPPSIDRKLKPAQLKKIQEALRHTDKKKFKEIQYLDLDLDSSDQVVASGPGLVKKSSENVHTPSTATVYKTVDFLKTEAFNRTRIEIEEERSRLCIAESAL